jgi:hypothetical protein
VESAEGSKIKRKKKLMIWKKIIIKMGSRKEDNFVETKVNKGWG